jgi:hypothetical protein
MGFPLTDHVGMVPGGRKIVNWASTMGTGRNTPEESSPRLFTRRPFQKSPPNDSPPRAAVACQRAPVTCAKQKCKPRAPRGRDNVHNNQKSHQFTALRGHQQTRKMGHTPDCVLVAGRATSGGYFQSSRGDFDMEIHAAELQAAALMGRDMRSIRLRQARVNGQPFQG